MTSRWPGNRENMAEGWRLIRSPTDTTPGAQMEDPTEVGRFLGCEHHTSTETVSWHGGEPTALDESLLKRKKSQDGEETLVDQNRGKARHGPPATVKVVQYDMRDFFRSCVMLYADLTGADPESHPRVPTPFGPQSKYIDDGLSGPEGRYV